MVCKITLLRDVGAFGTTANRMSEIEIPSTIRYRLYAGFFIIIAILALTVGSTAWGLNRSAQYLERANYSYDQWALVSELEARINQYLLSEIATTVNFNNRDRLVEAGPELITMELGNLQSTIEKETEFVKSIGDNENMQSQLSTAISLASVFIKMHIASKHERKKMLRLDSGAAVRSFYANVVEGNDKELSQVVRDIVKEERAEVEKVRQQLHEITRTITISTAILTILTAAGVMGLALFVGRSLVGPVKLLAEGAEKFGEGHLDHRINLPRKDEFGLVSRLFNKMAGQIESQQNLLRSHNERLEQAVQQRTHELETSNERLQQIDETRRRFFSNVSHELRTPVTVLLGEAEVALRAKAIAVKDLKEVLGRIIANGGFLRRRLNDLLSLARSDDGEIKLSFELVVLNELVEEAAEMATAYADANNVKLKLKRVKEDYLAKADPSWFKQSILVLIDNAVKFSKPEDTVTIEMELEDGSALIKVMDEGPGIEEEALPHLFERYYQASEGQKREGSGLGLAIAHWIVTGHKGKIWAENLQPTGTMITIKVELEE